MKLRYLIKYSSIGLLWISAFTSNLQADDIPLVSLELHNAVADSYIKDSSSITPSQLHSPNETINSSHVELSEKTLEKNVDISSFIFAKINSKANVNDNQTPISSETNIQNETTDNLTTVPPEEPVPNEIAENTTQAISHENTNEELVTHSSSPLADTSSHTQITDHQTPISSETDIQNETTHNLTTVSPEEPASNEIAENATQAISHENTNEELANHFSSPFADISSHTQITDHQTPISSETDIQNETTHNLTTVSPEESVLNEIAENTTQTISHENTNEELANHFSSPFADISSHIQITDHQTPISSETNIQNETTHNLTTFSEEPTFNEIVDNAAQGIFHIDINENLTNNFIDYPAEILRYEQTPDDTSFAFTETNNPVTTIYTPTPVNHHRVGSSLRYNFDVYAYADYTAGRGIGYDSGYTTLGALVLPRFLYFQPFIDLRTHYLDNNHAAFNFGLGARFINPNLNKVFGVSFYYDYRNNNNKNYNQLGLGLEILGGHCDLLDVRMNFYLPIGDKWHACCPFRFDYPGGFFAIATKRQKVLRGLDFEIASTFSRMGLCTCIDPYIGVGAYYYRAHCCNNLIGAKGRIGLCFCRYFYAEVRASYDPVFNTRVQGVIGFSYYFGKGRGCCDSPCGYLECVARQPVQRQDIIVQDKKRCSFETNF